MRSLLLRRSAIGIAATLFAVALSGCAVEGGYAPGYDDSYGYGGGVGIGFDYYEPYGAFYGGWGPSYHVAPYRRGGEPHWDRGAAHRSPHAYRSAPESRSMPSIPSHPRSGGTRYQRR